MDGAARPIAGRKAWRPRPWLSLLRAVLCSVVLPIVLALAIVLVMRAVVALRNGTIHAQVADRWSVPHWAVIATGLLVVQLTMLVTAWRRGGREGDGDRAFNLGLLPIRRYGLLIALLPATLVVLVCWVALLQRWILIGKVPDITGIIRGFTGYPALDAIIAIVAIGLLPATCEELFFRGWLWQTLRRSWPPLVVGCVTTVLWLLPHALEGGLSRPLLLLPIGVSLACARHFCGSVKASWIIHAVNNLSIVGFVIAARL